jgi:signal transduction histidine kinase
MLSKLIKTNNISKKLLRIIFSIYFCVTFLVTCAQFLTEYLKTQDSILSELKQLEQTVHVPISTSVWQYNQKQLEALTTGLIEMPVIEGVDVLGANGQIVISKRSYSLETAPLSIFDTKSDLNWVLNGKKIPLGELILYSSSEVVFDRVLFGFFLIAFTAIIKLSILFCLFIWAVDRYLAAPLKKLMLQVDEVHLGQNTRKRINLSISENNEISQLQEHMNVMLSAMERDRELLLEDEKAKRAWLEDAVSKRTEELLMQKSRLEYEVDVKNRFFSIISHDLKSPFNSLLGMTHMMSEMADNLSKDKLVEYAKSVNEAGDRVFELLQNLLEWSRLQMEGVKFYRPAVPFSLRDLAQENIDVLMPIAMGKNISLTNNIKNDTAFADPDMAQTVIRNLVSNSIKFTPKNGKIEISSKQTDGMVQVTVSDTGVGLSKEQTDKIFALDHKASTIGTAGERGTGLGLPLCKEMIEKYGGKIWVESVPGEGTQFHFTLPIEPEK